MGKKYAQNVVSGVKTVPSLPYHKPDAFFYPILMGKNRVPGAKLWAYYFFLHITDDLARNPTVSWADRHRHPEGSDEIYLVIGDSGAITVEVTLGNNTEMETYEIISPGAVFIPAGITHSIKPIKMTPGKCGGILAIVSNGEYITLPPK
jgi:mannose-6-phosphate isomerase-like protein (cupin superfamily)